METWRKIGSVLGFQAAAKRCSHANFSSDSSLAPSVLLTEKADGGKPDRIFRTTSSSAKLAFEFRRRPTTKSIDS
jgi:hypothetical protein